MVGREAALWRQLDHPNVLPFLGVDETTFSPHYALVSPWMKNGNLVDYVARVKLSSGDVNLLVRHMAVIIAGHLAYIATFQLVQTSDGLSYLHSQEIVHGDLRAANILITDAGQACLSDFGLTRVAPTATLTATTTLGRASTRWTAPELLKEEVDAPDPPSDVYSFGYVCLEAYTLKPPFWDVRSEAVVLNKILQGHVVRRPTKDECSGKELSDELWSLMTGCWSSDPSRRPSARRSGSMIRDTLVRGK
ncbi:kinase-like protein [Punctularia strigosozonata HHB-11173 SS5]|uniref:kinase-like protein n=1 Tax=Punctularia strigosozonata (strain HHB-11173) TaxID=741275 RepID=UPI0004416C74|nr:kinase-like protein [Punctularia strigosozonata HHB-11173 SS5]EIN08808.1 kinase-like protein [Punctularia strigosozonata HHB-11173 SS5]